MASAAGGEKCAEGRVARMMWVSVGEQARMESGEYDVGTCGRTG